MSHVTNIDLKKKLKSAGDYNLSFEYEGWESFGYFGYK